MSLRLDIALRIGSIIGGDSWDSFFLANEAMMDYVFTTKTQEEISDMVEKFLMRKIEEVEEDGKWE